MEFGPSSICWRYAGDIRNLVVAGRVLALQVAHPVVGAGVEEHSDFRSDPWGRLVRTLEWVTPLVYAPTADAEDTGRRLRALHRGITGTDAAGRRYTAMDPEAYHWVHATLFDGMVVMARELGPALRPGEVERFYDEWREVGRRLAVREQDMPPTYHAFRTYFRAMVHDRLEHTAAVRDVASTVRRPRSPVELPGPLRAAWPAAWAPFGHLARLSYAARMPAVLRDRFEMAPWTTRNELEWRAVRRLVRQTCRVLPAEARYLPLARRHRRAA